MIWKMIQIVTTFAALGLCASAQDYRDGLQSVVVTYGLKSPKISLGEPLILTFVVSNESSKSVTVDFGLDYSENLVISVRDPDGKITERSLTIKEGLRKRGLVFLGPHETSKSGWLALTDWFQAKVEGEYLVLAHWRDALEKPKERNTEMKLTVGAASHQQLVDACRELAQTALGRVRYRAEEAAKALSYIDDADCIPSIGAVLRSSDTFDAPLIGGLGRAKSHESTELLLELTGSDKYIRGILARGALDKKQSPQR